MIDNIHEYGEPEEKRYLESGEQTRVAEHIESLAEKIRKMQGDTLQNLLGEVKNITYDAKNKTAVFRKRTSEQILSDGFATGCTDRALVFIATARALGIPAKYVETVDKKWIENKTNSVTGHVYAKVFWGGEWTVIDPEKGTIGVDINNDKRVVFKEGFDSWDIGINDFESLKKSIIRM